VEPAWRECFELAWEGFRAGSLPVGAVLADPSGAIVSRGRNRLSDDSAPAGQVSGSFIAHAEINALATLPPGDYTGFTLYSTLEPCFLCTAALRHSHVGAVRFAAPDPVSQGVERLPELNPSMARRWPRREGPIGGPLEDLGAVLHLISAVDRGVTSVIEGHEATMPEIVRLARRLAKTGTLRGLTLTEALTAVWPELPSVRLGQPSPRA
jgi:tRNA(Arg) A34 adenosine deaminase TadA